MCQGSKISRACSLAMRCTSFSDAAASDLRVLADCPRPSLRPESPRRTTFTRPGRQADGAAAGGGG